MKILIFGANGMLGNYVMEIVDGIKIPITRNEYDIEKKRLDSFKKNIEKI